ncbi:phosphoribosylformylglycinamidine synthase subunit PurL [Granulicella sibirica]|nr:phosphoribosylformylglycinamidine synthase subunit PurL [Granulicella sibirica]
MPKQQVQPHPYLPAAPEGQTPSPCTITPALLKTHSITQAEYESLHAKLGRTPSLTELGIFSVMWSEHCSYKSSRVHLKRLPTKGDRLTGPGSVVQGPGENAGIIDVGDGWACAFKIESHNHPSYIEPYQGAATGVGGILRDIFTMNARPMAVMDSLRFGPLSPPETPEEGDPTDYHRNRHTMQGVVHGVAGYGNCFGVPNLGGETRFESCYSGNPLLNAFALGLVRKDEIFYAKATGVGNPVIYVGAKTGRDGIHGATMASEEFTEGSEQKRPNVQMGDPFLEKLLLEACLEAMATGAVLGIQDMGAAGLTCSTCEMGARGELGVSIELDLVPQRETGMTSYEIMLSESQERMLLVADAGREQEVLDVFTKWGLDASIVGTVTADDVMRVFHHGELIAEIPNKALTDEAPVYHRPVGTWTAPVPKDPPAWVLEELKKPRDYTADLKRLLASANICDKRWIYEQYDSMVQTNTVQGPGGEAGVIRIKGTGKSEAAPHAEAPRHEGFLGHLVDLVSSSTPEGEATLSTGNVDAANPDLDIDTKMVAKPERGLAMALAGNGRWTYLDPKLGAMHAVAEAARKVACTGATPVAATNCLNFGNPEKPEIMAQLSEAIDGIAEACKALGTPVTGGNVSLYNETRGEGIYPTPVIGIVGILDDVSTAVPNSFRQAGDLIVFLSAITGDGRRALQDMGATAYAQSRSFPLWGEPPVLSLNEEAALHKALTALASNRLLASAADLSDGGAATAIARACMPQELGAAISMKLTDASPFAIQERLFSEVGSSVIASCRKADFPEIQALLAQHPKVWAFPIGEVSAGAIEVRINEEPVISASLAELQGAYSQTIESNLAAEVATA